MYNFVTELKEKKEKSDKHISVIVTNIRKRGVDCLTVEILKPYKKFTGALKGVMQDPVPNEQTPGLTS